MIGSSSTEEDGAVVAPLTSGAAMTETRSKKICVEEVYVDRLNIWSAQSGSLKSNGKINPSFDSQQHSTFSSQCMSHDQLIFTIPAPFARLCCCANLASTLKFALEAL